MNKYILYNQETHEELGKFKAIFADSFELISLRGFRISINQLWVNLEFMKSHGCKFAIVDPNGIVLFKNLILSDVVYEDGILKIKILPAPDLY